MPKDNHPEAGSRSHYHQHHNRDDREEEEYQQNEGRRTRERRHPVEEPKDEDLIDTGKTATYRSNQPARETRGQNLISNRHAYAESTNRPSTKMPRRKELPGNFQAQRDGISPGHKPFRTPERPFTPAAERANRQTMASRLADEAMVHPAPDKQREIPLYAPQPKRYVDPYTLSPPSISPPTVNPPPKNPPKPNNQSRTTKVTKLPNTKQSGQLSKSNFFKDTESNVEKNAKSPISPYFGPLFTGQQSPVSSIDSETDAELATPDRDILSPPLIVAARYHRGKEVSVSSVDRQPTPMGATRHHGNIEVRDLGKRKLARKISPVSPIASNNASRELSTESPEPMSTSKLGRFASDTSKSRERSGRERTSTPHPTSIYGPRAKIQNPKNTLKRSNAQGAVRGNERRYSGHVLEKFDKEQARVINERVEHPPTPIPASRNISHGTRSVVDIPRVPSLTASLETEHEDATPGLSLYESAHSHQPPRPVAPIPVRPSVAHLPHRYSQGRPLSSLPVTSHRTEASRRKKTDLSDEDDCCGC